MLNVGVLTVAILSISKYLYDHLVLRVALLTDKTTGAGTHYHALELSGVGIRVFV
jgi:hypothetical protein